VTALVDPVRVQQKNQLLCDALSDYFHPLTTWRFLQVQRRSIWNLRFIKSIDVVYIRIQKPKVSRYSNKWNRTNGRREERDRQLRHKRDKRNRGVPSQHDDHHKTPIPVVIIHSSRDADRVAFSLHSDDWGIGEIPDSPFSYSTGTSICKSES